MSSAGHPSRSGNVRTRLHGLLDLMDPSPLPKNRRLSPDDFADAVTLRRASRSEAELQVHRDRLTWCVNQVLEASFGMLPRELRRRWSGSVAVDATVVPAYARAETRAPAKKGKKGTVVRHSSDPDARTVRKLDRHPEQGLLEAQPPRYRRPDVEKSSRYPAVGARLLACALPTGRWGGR
jgi:hypothetical protein